MDDYCIFTDGKKDLEYVNEFNKKLCIKLQSKGMVSVHEVLDDIPIIVKDPVTNEILVYRYGDIPFEKRLGWVSSEEV